MALYKGDMKVAGRGDIPIIYLTKAAYDALTTEERMNNLYATTDELETTLELATALLDGLMPAGDKAFSDGMKALYYAEVAGDKREVIYFNTTGGTCNDRTEEWHLGGNGSANYPVVGAGIFWYVNTIFYNAQTGYAKQIAYGYSTGHQDRVFTRRASANVWGAWKEVETGYYVNLTYGLIAPATTLTSGYIRYYPATRTVEINIVLTTTTLTINTIYPLLTIQSGYAPGWSVPLASVYSGVVNHTSAYIGSDGQIRYSTETATTAVYINGSYKI